MVHASLFSGIGGPEVAAAMLGWENAFHCEINPFGRRVLDYWFPESKSYEDITKTSFKEWRGKVDVLTGGFPCQPFSLAGKRGGANDNRYLWPEMLRVITEVRPTWVVGENVAGITTMVESVKTIHMGCEKTLFAEDGNETEVICEQSEFTIERICRDLEHAGYTVQPMLIPACAVGAPHRRDRIFFLAHIDNPIGNGDCEHSRTAGQEQGEERLQERNDVRKFGKSSSVRSENGATIEDPFCVGCGFGELEEQGCIRNERNISTGNAERICAESRTDSADTNDTGLESLRQHREDEVCESCSPSDTNGKGGNARNQHVQSELADGTVPVSNGRVWSSAYANGKGLEESQLSGRRENQEEGGAGLHDRVERPHTCDNGRWSSDDTGSKQSDRYRFEQSKTCMQEQEESRRNCCEDGGGYFDAKLPTNSDHTDVEQLCEESQICKRENSYLSRVRESLLPENRWRIFPTVSPVYRGNDGLPFSLDDLTIPFGRWKTESLKAYGNAIVVQVMYEIFRAIESVTNK